MPRGLSITDMDVDSGAWQLQHNTCFEDVVLISEALGETHCVGKKFTQKVPMMMMMMMMTAMLMMMTMMMMKFLDDDVNEWQIPL